MIHTAAFRKGGVVALLLLAPPALEPMEVSAAADDVATATGAAAPTDIPADSVPVEVTPMLPLGEDLRFSGRFGLFGDVGKGRMAVENDHTVRGQDVIRLDFDFEGRAMLRTIRDRTTSWVEPGEGMALRYHKDERHPLGSREEEVEIFPEDGRWEDRDGTTGELPTSQPLDELSFIYMVRGLELEEGEVARIERHFDAQRNPVEVEALGSDTIEVPAGEFPVDILEMRVRDEERFNGGGSLVLFLTQDEERIPVRIESKQSRVGTLVLRLEERRGSD